jgi:hypothetical protein
MATTWTAWAAVVAAAIGAHCASAEVVSVEFSGVVLHQAGASAHYRNLVKGAQLTGVVAYDTSTPGTVVDRNVVAYVQNVPQAVEITIGPHQFRSEGESVAAAMTEFVGVSWLSGADEYHRSFSVSDGLLPDSERRFYNETDISGQHVLADGALVKGGVLVAFIDDPSLDVPPPLGIPNTIEQSVFRFGRGEIRVVVPEVVDLGGRYVTFLRPAEVVFAIDHLRTIPEPSGALLVGFFGVWMSACRRRPTDVNPTKL